MTPTMPDLTLGRNSDAEQDIQAQPIYRLAYVGRWC